MTTPRRRVVLTPNQQAWVAALREPDRRQVKGALAVRVGHIVQQCCLGVACEVAGLTSTDDPAPPLDAPGRLMYDGEISVLPPRVQEWLEVQNPNPNLNAPRDLESREGEDLRTVSCAGLNDAWGLTFSQIADLVEHFGVL